MMGRRRIIGSVCIALSCGGVLFACGLGSTGTGENTVPGNDASTLEDSSTDGGPGTSDTGVDPATQDGSTDAAGDAASADDAGVNVCDPVQCMTVGGTCGGNNICTIDCTNSSVGGCAAPTCPVGHSCVVKCGGGQCHGAISCQLARSCDIQCTGGDSCQGSVTCSGAACKVTCSGGGSCHSPITCTADRCNVVCNAGDTCTTGVACNSALSCSVSCSNSALCNVVDIRAPDAALSCTSGDCAIVACRADAGKCNVGCGASSCGTSVCCSGTCTGTNKGSSPAACP